MRWAIIFIAMQILVFSGCATFTQKAGSPHVSSSQYSSFSCKQLEIELHRISQRIKDVSVAQDKKELAKLKGEYETAENTAIESECEIADKLKKAREERKRLEHKRKMEKERMEEEEMDSTFIGS